MLALASGIALSSASVVADGDSEGHTVLQASSAPAPARLTAEGLRLDVAALAVWAGGVRAGRRPAGE